MSHASTELERRLEAIAERGGPARGPMRAALVGGKRLRAGLALAAAEAAGGSPSAGLDAALAVELVHAASLVVDDLPTLDGDAERRGGAAVHAMFSPGVATVCAHALVAEAHAVLASQADAELVRAQVAALAAGIGVAGMAGGQIAELLGSEDHDDIAARKTGSLFAVAARLGALAGGAASGFAEAAAAAGLAWGVAYQIHDDWCDGDRPGDAALARAAIEARLAAAAAALDHHPAGHRLRDGGWAATLRARLSLLPPRVP